MERLDPVAFHRDEAPRLLASARGVLAGRAADGLAPLVLEVDGSAWTYLARHGRLDITDGPLGGEGIRVALGAADWSDLARSMRTLVTLQLVGALELRSGTYGQLARWEGALRAVYSGTPVYDPGRVDLTDGDGNGLDLGRTFTLEDPDGEMAEFLDSAGYLHVRGVLGQDEVGRLAAEAGRIQQAATPDDPFTWWAERSGGNRVLCRVIYADRRGPGIASLSGDPRMCRLAGLLGSPVVAMVDRMDGPTLLLKPAGELRGLANLPWHQDCGLGGHPVMCPAVSLGVQLTGASPETGLLEVIAGSHGHSVRPDLDDAAMVGWPRLALRTQPGDVTVHVQDVVHRSPAPTGPGGRTTLYLSYFPPGLADHVGPGEAVNDLIRGRQGDADALRSG